MEIGGMEEVVEYSKNLRVSTEINLWPGHLDSDNLSCLLHLCESGRRGLRKMLYYMNSNRTRGNLQDIPIAASPQTQIPLMALRV